MKKNFLFVNTIISELSSAKNEFVEIKNELNLGLSDILLKGLFTYQVSKFEITLNEILKMFLNAFPEKIPEKSFRPTKEKVIENSESLISSVVDSYINELSYKNLHEYLKAFVDITGIDKNTDDIIDKLIEMKETRNLLVHNDLKVNEIYIMKCKSYKRASDENINKSIDFDEKYIKECLNLCLDFIDSYLLTKLQMKYKDYTKIKAMKEIWDYLFNTPILKFDEFWEHDGTYLHYFKMDEEELKAKITVGCSTTEKMSLFYLLIQYNDSLAEAYLNKYQYRLLPLGNLYGKRKENHIYLQEVLTKYPTLFQQDII